MKEHLTSKALVGTGIIVLAVIIGSTIANVWVTPMIARTMNSKNTNPPATV